jgi:hypothetical protein
MPADGMSAAAKINRKNKRTSASPDWQLTREATLSSCALQCVGLTGSPHSLERPLAPYDHSAYIYLIDLEGKLAKSINGDEGRQAITETLSALMAAR